MTYYNPNIRIIIIGRKFLRTWRSNDFAVSFWRMYWNSRSGATISLGPQTVKLTPKRIILVPPNTGINQRLAHGAPPHFYTHFFADAPYAQLNSKIYTFKAGPEILSILKSFPLKDDPITAVRPTMAVHGLVISLLARIPDTELKTSRASLRLSENMSFIETHVQQSVSNREIARHLGMSVNSMLRCYHRELGITPQAYLRQKRIERACALLHDQRQSIKQVAEKTGFCDRYYFTRTFKKLQGVTPSQYQRQLK
ncbi:MAG: AraC family transcriptional regulator [Kiritimatiellae bacterium]|nr:AraC family transcriptional regulator [Kiritimatiellia bacterium]